MDSSGGEQRREAESAEESTAADLGDRRSFVVMIATTLVATALVLGMMWVNGLRYDSLNSRPIAEQQ